MGTSFLPEPVSTATESVKIKLLVEIPDDPEPFRWERRPRALLRSRPSDRIDLSAGTGRVPAFLGGNAGTH